MNIFFRGISLARLLFLACGSYDILKAADMVLPARPDGPLRAERLLLPSGAELITLVERLPEGELPLIAVLKDTLGDFDPDNDRLRQVWVFTYSQPSVWQRAAGGLPFFYHRAGLDRGPGNRPPRPVLDLGEPRRGMWGGLAVAGAQSEVVNPVGSLARLTTHSFFGNYGEYRNTHVWEAADVVSPDLSASLNSGLTVDEIAAIEERIELTGHPLGGLVGDEFLTCDHEKLRTLQTETRGHNWELLRQRAEESGLYLQPLAFGRLSASMAILWIAQPDLEDSRHPFEGQFLNISNPFSDDRLRHWSGYTETWFLDRNGVMVSEDTVDGRPVKMIPLAMYGLDHPKTPLMLVDFRGSGHPPRREIGLKIAEDVTTGVFGLTGFVNVGFLAAKSALVFVHSRHGGATNRSARRREFVLVRHAVGADLTMDPNLRKELLSRIEKVDVNPIERSWDQEIRDARKQYESLLAYAQRTGLEREIAKSRGDETRSEVHGKAARTLLNVASIGTLGIYRHREVVDDGQIAKLDKRRRDALAKRPPAFLPPGSQAVLANEKNPVTQIPAPLKTGLLQ